MSEKYHCDRCDRVVVWGGHRVVDVSGAILQALGGYPDGIGQTKVTFTVETANDGFERVDLCDDCVLAVLEEALDSLRHGIATKAGDV